jgi:1-deoxy-D-xylulose-5-phosphate reductoisomerase
LKNIAVFGSTGSIGRQALQVAFAHKDKIKIRVLAANANVRLLREQMEQFEPDIAVLADESAAGRLRADYRGKTRILSGEEGLEEAAVYEHTDMLLAAMSGFAGLKPTLAAIGAGKDIALANKETLVAAGGLVMREAARRGCRVLPVDSEHSAIFQALNGEDKKNIRKILLTASGGPFRGMDRRALAKATPSDCLKHPNWRMGPKITIDSSTLANKGLEIIEAYWLFGVDYDNIEVIVHPQSIVHSMIEYTDGAVIAQLGLPDMKTPIQYAFSCPDRWPSDFGRLDFFQLSGLTFERPDLETFPALSLALRAGKMGGVMPCVYNAANEQAVADFIKGRIGYLDIPGCIEYAMSGHAAPAEPSLPDILRADERARAMAAEFSAG